ncbi:acyl-CoA dehydrogenase family protein [Mycolicibacterium parafortuitum]|uniref:Putative acyl-CoA dehydrogenase [Ilumatobacter coccineus YM16-304] n=1 Tax=Mycolicibacterium parafortuitum TaxID=39692 RepID=A0A375YE67_MYCPF|nr:acyl-CoA dehydrogenase family protein [Mycolicibacterium parafortuitum]ORB29202.1 acyl-CoA dehydrogenase [Mycolicibacterium parafortuitum]SRX79416.1 putative acyl-CoA dehydrogenase [Ilumatobacter coccineus YM16-304] [Mycolicibacterium parafortuitum]
MTASEADALRQAAREFFDAVSPSTRIRELMATDAGCDRAVWEQMANELGLHGIAVPEQYGGAGAGLPELAVVFEEMGAALVCAPFFSTVALAVPTLLASGDDTAMRRYLPALVDGSETATVVLNGTLDAWDPAAVSLTARRDGTDYRLTGRADRVLDGHTANVILAVANTENGTSLFAVRTPAEGLGRQPMATLDRTRKVAALSFDGVPATLIGADGGAAAGLEQAYRVAVIAIAAEQVGAAQRCLDMAVTYARERIQFGRSIGSFQAVKHRCADMLVLVEGARSAAEYAAGLPDGDEQAVAASVAKMVCSEAFLEVALDNMRIHGGIGFTWEHDAHLYMRRAKTTQLIFGTPDHHAQRLATLVTSSSP